LRPVRLDAAEAAPEASPQATAPAPVLDSASGAMFSAGVDVDGPPKLLDRPPVVQSGLVSARWAEASEQLFTCITH